MQTARQVDLTRVFLAILILATLIIGSLWILRPFLVSLIWATTIVIATWPLLERVERRFGGRRLPASLLMTLVVLAIFVVPVAAAVTVLLNAAVEAGDIVRAMAADGLPAPPAWLAGIPAIGERLTLEWQTLAAGGPEGLAETLRPFLRSTASIALAVTGGIGTAAIHFLLTAAIIVVLYQNGEIAARGVVAFCHRVGAGRGEHAAHLAARAVRGVALGIVITALVQSLITGLGLWLADLPRPGLLLAIVFVLCIAQLGPLPVLAPAIIWLFWTGDVVWGTVMIVFTVIVTGADNILKPLLIRRGVELPMLLIVAGVVGGLIGFGVLGLFIGPTILAVTYTLLDSWIHGQDGEGIADAGSPAPDS